MDTQVDNDFTQTQPSAASNLRATGLPVDGRPPSPPPSIARQQRHAPLRTRTIGSDLDVVPDSENADDAEPGPPSSPETISIPLGPPTPVKKAKYVRTPVARIASPEIVPDSFIEEEEEEEEEAPLAIATRKKTSLEVPKGKTRERSTISPVAQKKPSSRLAETAPPRTRKQSRSATKPPGSATSRREEAMEVVPSSLPLQDYPEPAAKSVRPYKKKKPMRTRAAPVTPVQSHSSPLSESSDAESVVIPDYVPEEAPIEPTPTEVSLDEEYEGATNATTSRKRKRIASTSKTKLNLRSASKVSKTPSITPDKRSAKRQKSTCSSRNLNNAPTRVFAVWKQDNHYYAGTVHSSCDSGRFKIHFDDETEDDVHINYIRRCELNEGDHVISNITKGKGKVVDGSRCAPDNVVIVEFDNGEELDQQELDLRDIKIANRSITSQWKDRMLNADDIVTIVKPKGVKLSPSSSKLSLNSSASSTRKLFMKTGFVVTLSILDENPDKKRNQLTKDLKSTSGEVFEDWSNIFDMPGTYSLSGKRWEITKGEVTFDKGDDLHRVFLLSDDANQKPKFLFALALGIPCIRTEWLSDSIHSLDEKEWSSYLLPAGTSMKLGARVSQAVDLDWCNSPHHLTEIMENPVPAKVFSGKHILCLSPDYLPVKAKKGDVSSTDKSAESSRQVPYIILAMGSSRVEAVAGPEHASLKIKDYDYVIVKEDDDVKKFSAKHRNANFVPFHWVKQCLIAGRLFPNSP
ncbi:hypothetical protein EW026_g3297 [Hermanssonia centrifuga]|uniref:BRCT domain-containing protein n=1 Tax=Hermanssonia centrifuga TaxID=98765 RepID=A0A4S4KKK6_9APHY|nr:hypothetical protein EW026_g3297 [Hermanssonia centrifuga]